MKTAFNPCPTLTGETSAYLTLNPLDGELSVDLGKGEGLAWQPSGQEGTDFTTLEPERAMAWARQNNVLAASRNPLIASLPEDYFTRDHDSETAWPLVKYELAGPKNDIVFARVQNPSDGRFLQVGMEFAAREGKKAVPVTLATPDAVDDDEVLDLDLNPFRWGGFVHLGGEKVRASFSFDETEVCQEFLSFTMAEDALRTSLAYLLKDRLTEATPIDLLEVAADYFVHWQFPTFTTLQNGRLLARIYTVLAQPLQIRTAGLPKGVVAQKIHKGVSSLADVKDAPFLQAELREDGRYEFTVYRPPLREYGPKLILQGPLRRLVAALLIEENLSDETKATPTVDGLMQGIQTAAPLGRVRLPKAALKST